MRVLESDSSRMTAPPLTPTYPPSLRPHRAKLRRKAADVHAGSEQFVTLVYRVNSLFSLLCLLGRRLVTFSANSARVCVLLSLSLSLSHPPPLRHLRSTPLIGTRTRKIQTRVRAKGASGRHQLNSFATHLLDNADSPILLLFLLLILLLIPSFSRVLTKVSLSPCGTVRLCS